MAQNLKLFVNYRRADHADFVGTIRTHFMHRYGRENVFMDFDTIPAFARFEGFIREKVRESDALVAIIGPRWLDLIREREESGDPDYVRAELEEALKHGKVIAPVCIKGAQPPPLEQVPESLRPIFDRNAAELRDGQDILDRIHKIMDRLEDEVAQQGTSRKVENPPTPEELAEATESRGEFNIHEALGRYYEAKQTNDLPKALIWLARMRESGAMIPDYFNLNEEEAILQSQIKEEEEAQRRREVVEYLYGFARVMAQYGQDITEAMNEVWQVEPGYDPDRLIVKGRPPIITGRSESAKEKVEKEASRWSEIEDLGLPVEAVRDPILGILPSPFEWVEIPAGQVTLENDRGTYSVEQFMIAKYPVTYAQFQRFIDASDGFYHRRCWEQFPADIIKIKHRDPGEQAYKHDNHPRENVSWYDAMAFCCWLNGRLDYTVRLPTEMEWQLAAQGPNKLRFPWGNEYAEGLCNFDNIKGGTTPVTQYPQGASPYGVMDMIGNVWEWCWNHYHDPTKTDVSNVTRTIKGGSYRYTGVFGLHANNRSGINTPERHQDGGFRLARSIT